MTDFEMMVQEDMRDNGYDPACVEDVLEYWKEKLDD